MLIYIKINIFGFPIKNYYEKVGFNFSEESFESLANEFIRKYDEQKLSCSLHEGVEIFIEKSRNKGISHSILSASNIQGLADTISYYKINKYFLGINGLSDNFAQSKIEIGKNWINSLEFNNNEILLIGDTLHDFDVAKALNVDCILVSNGHQNKKTLKNSTLNVLESIIELDIY